MFVIALSAILLSGQVASPAPRSATDLTRDLNSGPPFAPAAPTQNAPTHTEPAQTPPVQAAPVPTTPAARPPAATSSSSQTRELNSTPPSAVRPTATAPAPAPQTVAPRPGVTAPPALQPAVQPAPVRPAPAPVPGPTQPPVVAAPSTPAPRGLDAAGIAALPFTLDLPAGAILTQARAGADAAIYSVRQNDRVLVMVYAGPASQFPIYDGQKIRAGGRATIVVTEDGRRLALEHLFQRTVAPQEIHVWVAAAEGADRDLGERIAQSVDAR